MWLRIDPLLNDLKFTFDDSQVDEDDEDEVYEAIITKLETAEGIFNTNNLNPYSYGYNDPVSFDDPDGRCPWCIVILAVYLLTPETAIAPTGNWKEDGKAIGNSKEMKGKVLLSVSGAGAATKLASVSKSSPAKEKAVEKTTEKKAPNPNGAKGKKDHQEKVKELEKKAKKENPNDNVVTEKKIKVEGSNRRPDVQVVDKKTGTTKKIYEAERKPNSARNKAREAEYEKLKIPHETHKVGE